MKRTIVATELILKFAAERIQEIGVERTVSSRKEWERLRSYAEALPDVGSLWLLDAKADLLMDSTRYPSHPMNFADREYFAPHREKRIEIYIGPVVKGRITQKFSFTITRRITGRDGAFAGILVAAIETDDFTNFLRNIAIGDHYKMLRPGEQRGLLQLVLNVHGREVVFMNTHIDYRPDDSERWSNVGEIEEIVRNNPLTRPADTLSPAGGEGRGEGAGGFMVRGRPIILCGDFNDTPESRLCRRLNETFHDTWALVNLGDGFTIPAANPRKRIDYIWISKDKSLVPLKVRVPQSDASDHLPVLAEFELR